MRRSTRFPSYQYVLMASLYCGCVLTIIYFTWDMTMYAEKRKPHHHRKPHKDSNITSSFSVTNAHDNTRRVTKHVPTEHYHIHAAEASTLRLPSVPLISVVWDLVADEQHSTYRYMSVYLKTLAIFNRHHLNIVFMVHQNEDVIRRIMEGWPKHYTERLNITVVAGSENLLRSTRYKEYSIPSMPFEHLFPLLDAVMLTNIDMIFLRSVSPLLEEFDITPSAEVIGVNFDPTMNSSCGLWLLNLTRMRDKSKATELNYADESNSRSHNANTVKDFTTYYTLERTIPVDWNFNLQICSTKIVPNAGISALQGCKQPFMKMQLFSNVYTYFESFKFKLNQKEDVSVFLENVINKNITFNMLCENKLDWEKLITYYPKQLYSEL